MLLAMLGMFAGQSANLFFQTTNDTYTVTKLPALPDRLRTNVTGLHAIYSFYA